MTDVTDVLARPALAHPQPGARLAGSGVTLAATTVAIGGALSVLAGVLTWAADPRSGATASQAVRVALAGWLLAQHVTIGVPGGNLSLPPLGLTALLLLLTVRGGRVIARNVGVTGHVDALRAVAASALPYAALSLTVAEFARSDSVRPLMWQAALFPGLLCAAGTAMGLYRERGAAVLPGWPAPRALPSVLRAGGFAAALLLCGGLVLFAASLAAHLGAAVQLSSGLRAGAAGGALLALLQVALLPNAAVAGAAYASGPGFAVGVGTQVAPLGVHTGALPALPLLAAVPTHAAALGPAAFALPVAAGLLGGLLLRRGRAGGPGPGTLEDVAAALASGLVAGCCLALAAALAGGSAGPGRMASIGASPWQVWLAVTAEVALAAALGTAAAATVGAVGALSGRLRDRLPGRLTGRLRGPLGGRRPARRPSAGVAGWRRLVRAGRHR